MKLIGDDPIVRCLERSGYPPWFFSGGDFDERDLEAARGEENDENTENHLVGGGRALPLLYCGQ